MNTNPQSETPRSSRKQRQLQARIKGVQDDCASTLRTLKLSQMVKAEGKRTDIFTKQKKVKFPTNEKGTSKNLNASNSGELNKTK